ncbi:MAG: VCBS repeat-containing protein, partial [Planctomycetales bacterium]|nr:VCBS repeat-containing protein [Planctomycetales bacterium]
TATYDEAFTISLNNITESSNNAPTDLSSGIELNTDGGNDAYLIAGNGGTVLGGLTSLTLEIQFATNDTTSFTPLFSYASPSNDNEFAFVFAGTDAYLYIADNDIQLNGIDYTTLRDGTLQHLAITWDNTNGDWAVYSNGELIEQGTGHEIGNTIEAGGELVFGNEQDSLGGTFQSNEAFQGALYDIRIWNEVRSEADISLNYQQRFDGGSLPSGLVANWQMDGFNGSNQVVDVVSGNNLSIGHATGTGFTSSTPIGDLHIAENSAGGTSVGYVVPTDPDLSNDIVSDGGFLKGDTGAWTDYTQGQTVGDWTVEVGQVSHTSQYESPLGGVGMELQRVDGNFPSAITQTLTTEVGRQYQLIFNMTGNFTGGDPVKHLVASAGGESQHFTVTNTATSGHVYEQRSMTFTADSTSTVLRFAAGADDGWAAVISDVRVIDIPAAVTTILNSDSTLSYDAATGKFYRTSTAITSWAVAHSTAQSSLLNGVAGNLVSIRSEYENDLVQRMAVDKGVNVWIGASDQTTEGEFYWQDSSGDDVLFWTGGSSGSALGYTNWEPTSPQNPGTGEDIVVLYSSNGKWYNFGEGVSRYSVMEWDASEVLSNFTFSLTDDAGGRFAIDGSTGEITVADGSQLDYETATSHNVTVQVTDATGNTYSEVMTIVVTDVDDTNDAPTFSVAGAGGFGGANLIASDGSAAAGVAAGDFDGDGDLDVVAGNQNTDAITWYESDGSGKFIASHTVSLAVDGPLSVYVSDIDGDGDLDILSASTTDNQIAWFENDGTGSFTTHSVSTTISGATGVAATDLDGDGDVDLLASGSSAGALYWFENDGSENFTTHLLAGGTLAPRMIAFADVDQDGHLDVLTASYGDDTIAWYENDGSQNFTEHTVTTTADGARYVQAIDLDQDGDIDLVGSSGLNNEVFWFENDGSENFTKHLLSSAYGDVWALQVSDLDLDGDLDIAFADFGNTSDVVWLENDGSQSFSVNTIATGVGNPDAIALSDLDNDGDLDVLTTSWSGGDVNWYENFARQTSLDGNPTFVEDGAAVVLDANVEIFDQELSGVDNFDGATLTLARNGGANSDDALAFDGTTVTTSGANVLISGLTVGTYTFTGGELTISFGANATNARVNTVMQNIVYWNSSDAPPASVQIDWTFDDGGDSVITQGSPGALSVTGSTTVNITATNDDPVLTLGPGGGTYNEGGTGTFVDVSGTLTDADGLDFDGGTIVTSISANGEADDRLIVRHEGTGGGQVNVVGSTIQIDGIQIATISGGVGVGDDLVVTFDADADATDVQKVVTRIAFMSVSENPSTLQRTISMHVTDGDGGTSTTDSRVMDVIAYNDDPTNAGSLPTDISVTEDVSSNVDLSAINLSDVDHNGGNLTLRLSTDAGGEITAAAMTGIAIGTNGTDFVTLTGTLADLNGYLDSPSNLTYLHPTANLNGDNADIIYVSVSDNGNTGIGGGSNISLGTVYVDITAVNDA